MFLIFYLDIVRKLNNETIYDLILNENEWWRWTRDRKYLNDSIHKE